VTPTSSLLLRQTRMHFPRFGDAEVEITPIEKGGSDRKFYRVRSGPEQTIILVKYNLEREENRLYVQVAEFLTVNGIRAPRVFFHDAQEGLIWIEDLGETDLWSYRNDDWVARRSLYDSALQQVAKLHALPYEAADAIRKDFPPPFDAQLYAWEQQYFFENCLGRHFGMSEAERAELAALPALQEIPSRLAELPRVLVHRDFQSQNIIVRDNDAFLIDFQGMRPGLAEYDLASLLYDPYVTLSAKEREQLFGDYCAAREAHGDLVTHQCKELLQLCAIQRLMQALGAYGFLGLVKGNTAFLTHIPAALASLRGIVADLDGAEKLHDTLSRLG
jgi:N-acetylmuramate 1-kinase